MKYMLKYYGIVGFLILLSCSTYENTNLKLEDIILRDTYTFTQIDTNKLEQTAKRFVISGSILQQEKKYAESILDFWEALKYDSSASIFYAIAKSYYKLDRLEAAIRNLQEAIKRNPNFVYAYELLGEIYLKNYQYQNALNVYKKIVELKPSFSNKLQLAEVYMLNYKEEKAIELFKELLAIKEDPEILLKLASYYESINNQTEANKYYERVFNTLEKNINTFDLMVKNYLSNNNYKKALNLLDSAKNTLIPEDVTYLFNYIGNELLDKSNVDSNTFEYIPIYLSKLDERFYYDWRINIIAGFLSFKINDTSSTYRYFTKAISADTNSQIPLTIAYFYFDNKLNDKAIETIKSTYPDHRTNFHFPMALTYFYFDKGETTEALKYATQAYQLDSNQIEILSQLGIIYDNLKKYDSCDYFYEKILKINPENPLINNNYAYSLAVRGERLEQALEMSRLALNAEPENPSFLDTYGWIMYKLGNLKEAETYLLKALSYDNSNYELYEHLGFLYLKMSNNDKAVEYFSKSLELKPDNEKVLKELKKINK